MHRKKITCANAAMRDLSGTLLREVESLFLAPRIRRVRGDGKLCSSTKRERERPRGKYYNIKVKVRRRVSVVLVADLGRRRFVRETNREETIQDVNRVRISYTRSVRYRGGMTPHPDCPVAPIGSPASYGRKSPGAFSFARVILIRPSAD